MTSSACPQCGTVTAGGDAFCRACGHALSEEAPAAKEGPAAPDAAARAALVRELRSSLEPHLQVAQELGSGGMGTVFLARDPVLKRSVAIKVLNPGLADDELTRTRFMREAAAAASVGHPNVVSIYQVGILPASRTAYFVMQFVDGQTLEEAFPQGSPAPAPLARRVIGEAAGALAAAHALDLVHRDIKPANIMIERGSGRTVVLDFGISVVLDARARPAEPKLTATGSSIGTPSYMSPEQVSASPVTAKTDVYSLGCVAFELLAGRPPFIESSAWAVMAAHLKSAAPRLRDARPDIDNDLANIVDACLRKDPAERPTAEEVARALLPGTTAAVEWPPPGLESLHRTGAALVRKGAWSVGIGVAILGMLAMPPASATAAWSAGESSLLWRNLWAPGLSIDRLLFRPTECGYVESLGRECDPMLVEATPLWLLLVSVCALALAIAALRSIRDGVRLARAWSAGKRLGYPASVLGEVALDSEQDSAGLINGSGMWALLSVEQRRQILLRRHAAARWIVGGSAVTALATTAWVLGAFELGATERGWLTWPEYTLAALPLLVAVAYARHLRSDERRIRVAARREVRRSRQHVAVAPSLVAGWLGAGGQSGALGVAPRSNSTTVLLLPTVAVLFTLLVLLPVVGLAHWFAGWHSGTPREWERKWKAYATAVADGSEKDSWSRIDDELRVVLTRIERSAVERGRVVPAPGRQRDTTVRRLLRTAFYERTDERLDTLAARADWPWLRDFAQFRDSLVGDPRHWVGGESRPNADLLAEHLVLATALAAEAGDLGAARAHAHSALTMARLAFAQGTQWRSARLMNLGLTAARIVETAAGNLAAATDAAELWDRVIAYYDAHFLFYMGMGSLVMSNPAATDVARFASDTMLSPSVRREIGVGAVEGICYNAREMFAGATPARRALVDTVVQLLGEPGLRAQVRAAQQESASALGSRRGVPSIFYRIEWCFGRINSQR